MDWNPHLKSEGSSSSLRTLLMLSLLLNSNMNYTFIENIQKLIK